jgi:hypothetical protein
MREHFIADWAFGIRGAIENVVRSNFLQDLRTWPLLVAFNFEAFILPENYVLIILKDKLSGIPVGSGACPNFPFKNHPAIPPKIDEIELWQNYLRRTFSLAEVDAPFLVPIKDSGKNDASQDYNLFSAEEQMFWNHQISYVISQHKSHIKAMTKQSPVQPASITYNVSGTGARININSADSSVNTVSTGVYEVFTQLREAADQVIDPIAKGQIQISVTEMEQAHGSSGFLQKYQAFITAAADHISIFGPFIPALTDLLT